MMIINRRGVFLGKLIIFRTDQRQAYEKGFIKANFFMKKDKRKDYDFNAIRLTEEDWEWLDDFMDHLGE